MSTPLFDRLRSHCQRLRLHRLEAELPTLLRAEALRRDLTQAGLDPRELDRIIRDLQRLDNDQVFADPRNLAMLQANALEKIKNWEFDLRKKAESADNQTLSLSGSDEMPAGFRTQIEEYYRSLAMKQ